jgi:opacity protein-like surface antigen
MFSGVRLEGVACIKLKGRACSLKTSLKAKGPILGAGALVFMLFSAAGAQAQCNPVGLNPSSPIAQAADMAVAGVSGSVGALVSSIYSANTAFLSQSSAFIGSPANPEAGQEGGGVWARGVGGHLNTKTTSAAGNISFGGPLQGASITCNTRTIEDFAGVQVGTDIARLNVNGWNLHMGSTIGHLGSKTQDTTPATPGFSPAASFRDSLQIPFVGAYGAASYGGFLVDAQVRGNFFQNEVSDDNQGLSGHHFDARGISLTGNIAYYQELANKWFVEPSAGIVWSRTHVDKLNVTGTGITGTPLAPGVGFVPPWTLTVNDIDSTLGRLSVRVGTTVTSGNVVWQPFATASVMHEFQGGVTASLLSNFSAMGPSFANTPNLSSTISTRSFDTIGQFGLGVAAQVANTGWVSYLRGDYRVGDYIEGWSINGGLRYQFAPDPVTYRPGPTTVKAPIFNPPPAQAAYDWNGFYVGAYLGADWGRTGWNFVDTGAGVDPHFAGLLGGGEIGYNYQVGKWVFGVEGDVSRTNASGVKPCPTDFFHNCEINGNLLSTATARIGYAYWDRLLAYVKGGAVIAQDQAQLVCDTGSRPTGGIVVGCPSQADSKTHAGWTVGWGTEFGLTRNVSVKSEMMYFDLGSDRYNIAGTPIDIQRNGFISTIGLHYRFGG